MNFNLAKKSNFGIVECGFWTDKNNEVWMTREQIGTALGYSDPNKAISNIHARNKDRLDKFSVTPKLRGTDGKAYDTYLYNHKGLYEICRLSRQPKADAFMDWAWDVIESIRKHGMYATDTTLDQMINSPEFGIRLLTELKNEREERRKLEHQNHINQQIIGELKPKADYTTMILQNKGLVTITQIAKDYGISGRKMNAILHDLGVQYKQSDQWLLYSEYHDKGYTHSSTVEITRKDGSQDVVMNTKWSQKGRLFLYNLLKAEKGMLPIIERVDTAM